MTDDTHDKLVKAYLEYFAANEKFEQGPSDRTKRNARRTLRNLMRLAKQRQDEIQDHYLVVLEQVRASGKWASNKAKALKSKEVKAAKRNNT